MSWTIEEEMAINEAYAAAHGPCEFCGAEGCRRPLCPNHCCDVPALVVPMSEMQLSEGARAWVCDGKCVKPWENGEDVRPVAVPPMRSIFEQMARADLRQAAIEECWRLAARRTA